MLTVHHLVKDVIRSNNPSLISRIRDIGGENGFFVPYIEKRCIKYADKFIAVSNFTKKRIIETYKVPSDKIEVVYNGIDLSEYENLPKRGEFKRKYKIKDDEKIILYLGRIHKTKGIDLLIRAYADLIKDLDDVRLVIVGPDDGFLSTLKRQIGDLNIGDKTLFTGPLYGRDKMEAYVDADVFVNPRADEIFGLVFLEACACGIPVICSKGCGIADVIDGQAGIVVLYDKGALGKAILNILSDDKSRKQFGERGKLLVRERFNWEKISGHVESMYKGIVYA